MGSLVGLGKGGSARYHDGRCDHHQGEKLGAGRNLGCVGWQAELERFKHALKDRDLDGELPISGRGRR